MEHSSSLRNSRTKLTLQVTVYWYIVNSSCEWTRVIHGCDDTFFHQWYGSSDISDSSSHNAGQVEVVTPLPPGGALVVRTPSGFAFMAPCSPQAGAGQPGL